MAIFNIASHEFSKRLLRFSIRTHHSILQLNHRQRRNRLLLHFPYPFCREHNRRVFDKIITKIIQGSNSDGGMHTHSHHKHVHLNILPLNCLSLINHPLRHSCIHASQYNFLQHHHTTISKGWSRLLCATH
jgi:hypothetical protein